MMMMTDFRSEVELL